jgi:L,D-transpeptidase ErfK/SrfK
MEVEVETGMGKRINTRPLRAFVGGIAFVLLTSLGAAERATANRWNEDDFYRKGQLAVPSVVVESNDFGAARSVVGNTRFYSVQKGDTFLDLARFYGLGYNEIEQANPGVDPWIPPEQQAIVLPTEWVLPQSEPKGVVINIPEMRLYYFHERRRGGPLLVSTFPVGLGRDDWRTPRGAFKVVGKTKNPTWVIPDSIREERIREKGRHEKVIAGGSPDNPLGKYRFELSMPGYRIHGTNIPWGVGMQVSHGCVRLYPEDIEQLFPMVPIGSPGKFVYQPVKIGARDGRIYAEVHPDIYTLTPGLFSEARRILTEFGWVDRVDGKRLQRAVEEQSGVPLDVTLEGDEEMMEEILRPAGDSPEHRIPDRGDELG